MIENIKMLLNIADDKKDNIINYWIGFYTKMVLKYCHITSLNPDIEALIEQVIIERMGGIGSGGTATVPVGDNVKSISRGDYSITYKDATNTTKTSTTTGGTLDRFMEKYSSNLNLFRKFDME
jgi:hypothetical protein